MLPHYWTTFLVATLHPPFSGPSFANTPSGRVSITPLEQRENQTLHWPRMCNRKKMGPGSQENQQIQNKWVKKLRIRRIRRRRKKKKKKKKETKKKKIYKTTKTYYIHMNNKEYRKSVCTFSLRNVAS
jgi:hypothetical protein